MSTFHAGQIIRRLVVFLCLLVGGLVPACKRQGKGAAAQVSTITIGGLDSRMVTAPGVADVGGPVLVLLHGRGGTPDRYVGAARMVAVRGRLRVILPRGPFDYRDGRAWWLEEVHFARTGQEDGAWLKEAPDLVRTRTALKQALEEVRTRFRPSRLMLAGHSQGAMMALDLAVQPDQTVDRLFLRAGALLSSSLAGLRAGGAKRTSVLVSHGRQDPAIPFHEAETIVRVLGRHGVSVTLQATDDKHGMPAGQDAQAAIRFLVEN